MMSEAPSALRDLYRREGENFAAWIHDRPWAKTIVRGLMDTVIETRSASALR